MERICLGCGLSRLSRVRPYRNITRYGRRVFRNAWLYSCDVCGLVQVCPRPEAGVLAQYYAADYRKGGYHGSDVSDAGVFPRDNLFYLNRGRSITKRVAPYVNAEDPRILDIGAGFGHVLYAFGERYPKATRMAIEFSSICAEHLRSIGIRVYTDPVEKVLPSLEGQFDVIILSHVLEHLLAPCEVLALIRRSLVPGGLLYIEVPNVPPESLLRHPDHVWAPRFDEPHITFFSTPTLRSLMSAAGFVVESCDTAGPHYTYISSVRFNLPPLKSTVQWLLPRRLFFFLRSLRWTTPLRVKEREESFYQYGGFRLWIRCVSRKPLEEE